MYQGKFTASIILALGLTVPAMAWASGTLLQLRNQAEHNPAALQQLERQANTGDGAAQFYLGTLYDPSLKLGRIEAPDWSRALYWYQKAAQAKKDPVTCYPNQAVPQKTAQATSWWRMEAERSLGGNDVDNGHC